VKYILNKLIKYINNKIKEYKEEKEFWKLINEINNMTDEERLARMNEKRQIEVSVYINNVFIEKIEGCFTVREFREFEKELINELFRKYYPEKEGCTYARTSDIEFPTLVFYNTFESAFRLEKKIMN
jgi:SpoVK/Ycf46/Vps4 family AAA+-type ATPase